MERLPDNEYVLGLPSIGFSTSKEQLYELFCRSHKNEDNSELVSSRDTFKEYWRMSVGLRLGLVNKEEIEKALTKLATHPDVRVSQFWYDLSLSNPLVDSSLVKPVWEKEIESIEDPFRYATENAVFVIKTSKSSFNDESAIDNQDREKLVEVAEQLREVIPTYDKLDLLPEIDTNPLGEPSLCFAKDTWKLYKLSQFVTLVKDINQGELVSDLDQYLLDALPEIDVSSCDGNAIFLLLQHLGKSTVDKDIKLTRINMCVQQTDSMPDGIHGRDAVLEGAVASLLDIGEFEKALDIWGRMRHSTSLTDLISNLARYALSNGLDQRFREEYRKYVKLSGIENHSDSKILCLKP